MERTLKFPIATLRSSFIISIARLSWPCCRKRETTLRRQKTSARWTMSDNFLQRNVRNVWDSSRTVDDLLLKSVDSLSPLSLLSLLRLLRLLRLLHLLRTKNGNANHTLGSSGRKPPHPFKVITGLLNTFISIAQSDINVQPTSAAWRNPATTPMRGWTIGTGIIELPDLMISNIGRATPETLLLTFEKVESFFCSIVEILG